MTLPQLRMKLSSRFRLLRVLLVRDFCRFFLHSRHCLRLWNILTGPAAASWDSCFPVLRSLILLAQDRLNYLYLLYEIAFLPQMKATLTQTDSHVAGMKDARTGIAYSFSLHTSYSNWVQSQICLLRDWIAPSKMKPSIIEKKRSDWMSNSSWNAQNTGFLRRICRNLFPCPLGIEFGKAGLWRLPLPTPSRLRTHLWEVYFIPLCVLSSWSFLCYRERAAEEPDPLLHWGATWT